MIAGGGEEKKIGEGREGNAEGGGTTTEFVRSTLQLSKGTANNEIRNVRGIILKRAYGKVNSLRPKTDFEL